MDTSVHDLSVALSRYALGELEEGETRALIEGLEQSGVLERLSGEVGRSLRVKAGRRPEPSITCPVCGSTSYNPFDVKEGYCGRCHRWTSRREVWSD